MLNDMQFLVCNFCVQGTSIQLNKLLLNMTETHGHIYKAGISINRILLGYLSKAGLLGTTEHENSLLTLNWTFKHTCQRKRKILSRHGLYKYTQSTVHYLRSVHKFLPFMRFLKISLKYLLHNTFLHSQKMHGFINVIKEISH